MSACGCYIADGHILDAPCEGTFAQVFELAELPASLTDACVVLEFTLQRVPGAEPVVIKSSQNDGITILGPDTFEVGLDQADLALCPGRYTWCLKLFFVGKVKASGLTVDIGADGEITLTPEPSSLLVNDLLKINGSIAGNTATLKYDGEQWPQVLTQEVGASGSVHQPLPISGASGLSGTFIVRDC